MVLCPTLTKSSKGTLVKSYSLHFKSLFISLPQDQIDYDSLQEVIQTANQIAATGREQGNRLTVSDAIAERLKHTFPLESADQADLDFEVFRVTMPQPTLR